MLDEHLSTMQRVRRDVRWVEVGQGCAQAVVGPGLSRSKRERERYFGAGTCINTASAANRRFLLRGPICITAAGKMKGTCRQIRPTWRVAASGP